MKKTFLGAMLFSMCVSSSVYLNAQTMFRSFEGTQAPSKGEQKIQPSTYRLVTVDNSALFQLLSKVGDGYENASIVDLPTPDGKTQSFKIWKNEDNFDEFYSQTN